VAINGQDHAFSSSEELTNKPWIVDGAATTHVCTDRSLFISYREVKKTVNMGTRD
jgi:hypothetical protein